MPFTVQPTFGPYDYEAHDATIEEWNDEGTVRGAVSSVPRADVARAVDGFLGPRSIRLKGVLGPDGGGTRDQLRTAVDAFAWAHRPGYRALSRDTDRYIMAEVESITIGEDTGLSWVGFDLRFRCADPFYYAVTADTDTWAAPANGNTRDLDNDGAATALPVFTITVSATGTLNLTLENTTTGQSFTIAGLAVTNGQVLVIDCAAETVKLAGVNRMSVFEGAFFPLDPGTNTLELTLAGVSLSSIGTSWRKRWL